MIRITQHRHYLEIFPKQLWLHRRRWQRLAQGLPQGGYLLVADGRNQQQTKLIRRLARRFQRQGKPVIVWLAKQAPRVK